MVAPLESLGHGVAGPIAKGRQGDLHLRAVLRGRQGLPKVHAERTGAHIEIRRLMVQLHGRVIHRQLQGVQVEAAAAGVHNANRERIVGERRSGSGETATPAAAPDRHEPVCWVRPSLLGGLGPHVDTAHCRPRGSRMAALVLGGGSSRGFRESRIHTDGATPAHRHHHGGEASFTCGRRAG